MADSLEVGEPFRIQVAGKRVYIPANVEISIEHERADEIKEIEFQLV